MKQAFINKIYSTLCFFFLITLPVISHSQVAPRSQDDVYRTSASYSGTVYQKGTEKPISGARVLIMDTEKDNKIVNTITGSEGTYYFSMPSVSNIKVTVTMSGFKKGERSFTRSDLKEYGRSLPVIYLDTTIKIDFTPAAPVRQSKEDFVTTKLESLKFLPSPAAYDLLFYLNPDLRGSDSLMSNAKVVLPQMPKVKSAVTKGNKGQFLSDRTKDKTIQNRLRDSIDKLINILSDDISKYKIQYIKVDPETLKQLRQYMILDLQGYKARVSKTTKLKAEEIIVMINKIAVAQESLIAIRSIRIEEYERLKTLWEDLSYLLLSSRYMLFGKSDFSEDIKTPAISGPSVIEDSEGIIRMDFPDYDITITEPMFDDDEVGVFGFIVWSEKITSKDKPDLSEPNDRYLVQYFRPALKDIKSSYKSCTGGANIAVADLTRARYGVEVYDTKEKKVIATVEETFETDHAFTNKAYSNFLIADYKDIKYVVLHLKH